MAEQDERRDGLKGTGKALSLVYPSLGRGYSTVERVTRDVRAYARERPLKALMAAVGVGVVIGALRG